MKFEINNWGYEIVKKGKGHGYNITPPPDEIKDIPSTLFKYYSLSDNSIDALKRKYLYASHPQELNDPFDCYELLIDFDDLETIKKFLDGTLEDDVIEDEWANNRANFKHFVSYQFNLIIYGRLGIVSMTDDPINLLMWSYYSSHSGFVVELDYSKFNFKYHGPYQMSYQDSITPLKLSESGGHLAVIRQANIKASDWSHEGEWRILAEREVGQPQMILEGIVDDTIVDETTSRKFNYDDDCIKSIILGNNFFDQNNEIKAPSISQKEITLLTTGSNFKRKEMLLDEIIDRKLPAYYAFRDNKNFKLNKRQVNFVKVEKGKYIMEELELN